MASRVAHAFKTESRLFGYVFHTKREALAVVVLIWSDPAWSGWCWKWPMDAITPAICRNFYCHYLWNMAQTREPFVDGQCFKYAFPYFCVELTEKNDSHCFLSIDKVTENTNVWPSKTLFPLCTRNRLFTSQQPRVSQERLSEWVDSNWQHCFNKK